MRLAKLAYERFWDLCGGRTAEGSLLPQWHQLGASEQIEWVDAVTKKLRDECVAHSLTRP